MRPTRPSTATQPRQDARDGLWLPIDSKVSRLSRRNLPWRKPRRQNGFQFARSLSGEFLPAGPAAGTFPTCRTGDLP